jgi:response regulator RpfG family c-di-GMP phosphodiesterase
MTRSAGNGNGPLRTLQRVPTVLVVEDEENLRRVIRRLLQDEGYGVLEGENGATPHLAFLAKPFRNDDLLAIVRGQLERRA